MIGQLPQALTVNGIERAIRSDFRVALLIFQALNDAENTPQERLEIMLTCLYENFSEFQFDELQEATEKAVWFLGGGKIEKPDANPKKLMDWEQDEAIIFSAVNKVAGTETRSKEYMHWWTFLGYYYEIGESQFSSVINIRQKKLKGKKLEKHEQEFYRENKSLIDLKKKYTDEEQAEIDRINALLE